MLLPPLGLKGILAKASTVTQMTLTLPKRGRLLKQASLRRSNCASVQLLQRLVLARGKNPQSNHFYLQKIPWNEYECATTNQKRPNKRVLRSYQLHLGVICYSTNLGAKWKVNAASTQETSVLMSNHSFILKGDWTKCLEPTAMLVSSWGAGLSSEAFCRNTDAPWWGTTKGGIKGPHGIAASVPHTPFRSSSWARFPASPPPYAVPHQYGAQSTRFKWCSKPQCFRTGPWALCSLRDRKQHDLLQKHTFSCRVSYTSLATNIWLYQISAKYKSKCFSVSLFLQKD